MTGGTRVPGDHRGPVYTVTGGDWDTAGQHPPIHDESIVVNPAPSTRPRTACWLILELEGETGHRGRAVGTRTPASRRTEYRTWT